MKTYSPLPVKKSFLFIAIFFCLVILILAGCIDNKNRVSENSSKKNSAIVLVANDSVSKMKLTYNKTDAVLPAESSDNADIKLIRQQYAQIQSELTNGNLKKETKKFECKSDPFSGEMNRYYNGKDLVMLEYLFSGEHFWEAKHIYLNNERPFFAFEEKGSWKFGGPSNDTLSNTIDDIHEERYYIKNGLILKKLTKDFQEKSWEKNLTSEEIVNNTVNIKTGMVYKAKPALADMISGKAGCEE